MKTTTHALVYLVCTVLFCIMPQATIYCQTNSSLPVVMEKFVAEPMDCAVEISWETHLELNNDRFEILRSNDLEHWNMIMNIKGQANSAETLKYKYMDETPHKGTNFYKVLQVDSDGAVKYTQILSAEPRFEGCFDYQVGFYPNPSQNKITFNLKRSNNMMKRQLRIINTQGKIVLNQTIQSDQVELSVTDLYMGQYFVAIDGHKTFSFFKR